MSDVTHCPDPETLLVLLYDDEGTPSERVTLQAHVDRCSRCAAVLAGLDTTRGALGAWHAPRLPLGFSIVRTPPPSRWRSVVWTGGLAAAAVLLLAAAASLARIDITYNDQGLRIRTGVVAGEGQVASMASPAVPQPSRPTTTAVAPPSTSAAWVTQASSGEPPWRADLDLLATQIRADVSRLLQEAQASAPTTALRASAVAPAAGPVRPDVAQAELLKKVQDLLDQSEVRQQQNLALRVTELGRQFELQRQNDIVQVEQAFQRLEQQRNELLRRVAATQPRP
ncbi:hypothetical protein TBR22_A44380 [Luteitalea sp. TBR-22]|uniref:anti-sigma factor family protein n=1 Tax=Luteitalea sp. TBR-22 TaxID=2802971 RepID=UPI001AF0F619|nr:hypothetical protein [Luteitalea sp. TBR-22]BCS35211.1 hypothetical protein TBR22_A44380 [Luteitalea sp. TBR-22]